MNSYLPILVPFEVDLARTDGWMRLDNNDRRFCVVRFHCALTRPKLVPGPYYGEPEDGFGAPETLKGSASIERRVRFRTALTEQSLARALQTDRTLASVASTVAAKAQVPLVGNASAELKAELKDEIQSEFEKTFAINAVDEREWEETRTLQIKFEAEPNQEIFVVRGYSRCEYELWLGFIDYLYVSYEGLRRRRQKFPPVEGNRHINILTLKQSLRRIRYWKPIGESLWLVPANNYEPHVLDPSELTAESLSNLTPPHLELASTRTLYKISETVFPRKWRDLQRIIQEEAAGAA